MKKTITQIPILSKGSYGGEQKQFTLIEHAYVLLVYGLLILSFVTSIIFWSWFKKYWYINVGIFLFCFLLLYITYWNKGEASYYKDLTKHIGKDKFFIREEYNVKDNKIRSLKYWKNDYKDSTWKFYDKKGNIIEQRVYRNDCLIKVLK